MGTLRTPSCGCSNCSEVHAIDEVIGVVRQRAASSCDSLFKCLHSTADNDDENAGDKEAQGERNHGAIRLPTTLRTAVTKMRYGDDVHRRHLHCLLAAGDVRVVGRLATATARQLLIRLTDAVGRRRGAFQSVLAGKAVQTTAAGIPLATGEEAIGEEC